MQITYKWLKEYLDFPWQIDELTKKLTDTGLEVKAFEPNPLDSEDWVIELEVTPNRPDCLSMYGIAREMAAATGFTLREPDTTFEEESTPVEQLASVSIEAPENCYRYCGKVIRGIKIAPSPAWMAKRLEAVGIRSINNVVDVTNYVLMEIGHPLHSFDLNRLAGNQIIVRQAKPGEVMKTLDGQDRTLDPERLVIADKEKAVALAGVMGGANTEVLDNTVDLLLEAAVFNPISIRRTSKKLALRSESSYRFERGTDAETALKALNRAAALILQLAGGKAAKGFLDAFPKPPTPPTIELRGSRVERLLGNKVPQKTLMGIFERMGCKVEKVNADTLSVQTPVHRKDLEREVDLIEEVARLHGVEKFLPSTPMIPMRPTRPYRQAKIERTARETLVPLGFWEVINYTFVNSNDWVAMGFPKESMVALRNPMSSEQDVLRMSLLPGLMKNISRNMDQGEAIVRVFEIGRVMRLSPKGEFVEETVLAGAASGKPAGAVWEEKGFALDFYGFKGLVEYLFDKFELPKPEFKAAESTLYSKAADAGIFYKDEKLGQIGIISAYISKKFGIEKEVISFELVLDRSVQVPATEYGYKALPKFPAVERDISLLSPANITAQQIMDVIRQDAPECLESVELFDLYSGAKLPEGSRSLSFRITYRHPERTLQDTEVETWHASIIEKLTRQFDIKLRTA
jgi:phenylalanyl-tRNA synthetase beta chain